MNLKRARKLLPSCLTCLIAVAAFFQAPRSLAQSVDGYEAPHSVERSAEFPVLANGLELSESCLVGVAPAQRARAIGHWRQLVERAVELVTHDCLGRFPEIGPFIHQWRSYLPSGLISCRATASGVDGSFSRASGAVTLSLDIARGVNEGETDGRALRVFIHEVFHSTNADNFTPMDHDLIERRDFVENCFDRTWIDDRVSVLTSLCMNTSARREEQRGARVREARDQSASAESLLFRRMWSCGRESCRRVFAGRIESMWNSLLNFAPSEGVGERQASREQGQGLLGYDPATALCDRISCHQAGQNLLDQAADNVASVFKNSYNAIPARFLEVLGSSSSLRRLSQQYPACFETYFHFNANGALELTDRSRKSQVGFDFYQSLDPYAQVSSSLSWLANPGRDSHNESLLGALDAALTELTEHREVLGTDSQLVAKLRARCPTAESLRQFRDQVHELRQSVERFANGPVAQFLFERSRSQDGGLLSTLQAHSEELRLNHYSAEPILRALGGDGAFIGTALYFDSGRPDQCLGFADYINLLLVPPGPRPSPSCRMPGGLSADQP